MAASADRAGRPGAARARRPARCSTSTAATWRNGCWPWPNRGQATRSMRSACRADHHGGPARGRPWRGRRSAELIWAPPSVIEQAGIAAGWTEFPIWVPPDGELAGLHAGDVSPLTHTAFAAVLWPARSPTPGRGCWPRAIPSPFPTGPSDVHRNEKPASSPPCRKPADSQLRHLGRGVTPALTRGLRQGLAVSVKSPLTCRPRKTRSRLDLTTKHSWPGWRRCQIPTSATASRPAHWGSSRRWSSAFRRSEPMQWRRRRRTTRSARSPDGSE